MSAQVAARAKALIEGLRIKELHECLDRLGLRKAGRKQELINRLTHAVEEASALAQTAQNTNRLDLAARLIEECYQRVLKDGGRPALLHNLSVASAAPAPAPPVAAAAAAAPLAHVYPQVPPTGQPGRTVRCVCSSTHDRGEMVQCTACQVWQHADCLALPPLPPGQRRAPHWCEFCRAERCDPFWEIQKDLGTPMLPAKLSSTGKSAQCGTKMETMLSMERAFAVSQTAYELFKKRSDQYRLQLTCLQLNDTVTFRYHWPTLCDVRVNGSQYRVYSRGSHTKIGANQRDEAANISVLCNPPATGKPNRVSVSAVDNGSFVVMLQVAKLRTVNEVKNLMKPRETLAEATDRIRKQLGHGGNDEDELQVTHTIQSLRCPLSGARIRTPARFVDVPGMSCFDLDSFMSMVERSRRWQCPHSMRNSCIQNLQVDTYMVTLLSGLEALPDMNEVEIAPDAKWRPSGSARDASMWYDVGMAPHPFIKPEPGLQNGNGVNHPDDESEDEMEELRKAAAAVKRGQAPTEIIELLDSSDDEATRATKRRAIAAPTGGPSAPQAVPMPAIRAPAQAAAGAYAGSSSNRSGHSSSHQGQPQAGSDGGMRFRINVPAQAVAAARAASNGGATGLPPTQPPPRLHVPVGGGSGTLQNAQHSMSGVSPRNLGVTVVQGPSGPTISVQAMQPARSLHQPPLPPVANGLPQARTNAAPPHSPLAAAHSGSGAGQVVAPPPPLPVAHRPPLVAPRAAAAPGRAPQERIVIEIDSD